jgi:hypothetical protein
MGINNYGFWNELLTDSAFWMYNATNMYIGMKYVYEGWAGKSIPLYNNSTQWYSAPNNTLFMRKYVDETSIELYGDHYSNVPYDN